MLKLQNPATKPDGTKHFAGAVMLSVMLFLTPTDVAADSGGGVGYSDGDPSSLDFEWLEDLKDENWVFLYDVQSEEARNSFQTTLVGKILARILSSSD